MKKFVALMVVSAVVMSGCYTRKQVYIATNTAKMESYMNAARFANNVGEEDLSSIYRAAAELVCMNLLANKENCVSPESWLEAHKTK